ncbi:MAG: MCE family protein, partial [Bacteroidales bacterium]|nr:MCE family protein [Bacteroidales bacterium]
MKVRNEFQIVLAGLITIVILFLGIKFLKGTDIFSSNRSYYVIYDNVSGMHESSYIYINGMKAGFVKKITPTDKLNSHFLVEIAVDKKLQIPKDSHLTLFSDGLLGGKALRIDAGTSKEILSNKDTLIGFIESGMMDGLTSKIDPMMTDLSSVIKRIDTLTASMNNTFNAQSQENIRQT